MKKFIVCIAALVLMFVFQIVAINASLAVYASRTATDNARYCSKVIGDKISVTLDLLTAMANNEVFQNYDVSYKNKAAMLTLIAKQFGYMMIRVVDEEFNVYSEKAATEDGKASNLAKRDYMQELKRTLQPQVTDAFLAGADGKTVNFTVAVPVQTDGAFKGVLFAAIYETDFAEILSARNSALIGRKMQLMSGVSDDEYGMTLDNTFESVWLWGGTAEDRLLEIDGQNDAGSFWGARSALPVVYAYDRVADADWSVICDVSFGDAIAANPLPSVMAGLSLAVTAVLIAGAAINRKKFN